MAINNVYGDNGLGLDLQQLQAKMREAQANQANQDKVQEKVAEQNLISADVVSTYQPNASFIAAAKTLEGRQILTDEEAALAMNAVKDSLTNNPEGALSVHQGLNYNRVMQLLEGLDDF